MKKIFGLTILLIALIVATGFTNSNGKEVFNIDDLYDYQKEFKSEEINTCALGVNKTYMDYRATTDPTSRQFWYIRNYMEVDEETGFLIDEDGFIGAALGSYYGTIGDRYYFTLDNGITLPIVKIEEKADRDTDPSGCYHSLDGSVIEFVIDTGYASAYFGRSSNGLILQGNYANYEIFNASIEKVEKVLDELRDDYPLFVKNEEIKPNDSIFNYASGY